MNYASWLISLLTVAAVQFTSAQCDAGPVREYPGDARKEGSPLPERRGEGRWSLSLKELMNGPELPGQKVVYLQLLRPANAEKITKALVASFINEEGIALGYHEMTGSFLLRANAEQIRNARAIIEQLDAKGPYNHYVYIIQLKNLKARDVILELRAMPILIPFLDDEGDIRLTPDGRTNRIIISAPHGMYPFLIQLIRRMDGGESESP